ncbi:unnamed protein product [Dicrocoelium dendriticum]|nr:unnamed protein product [Dicrocoelium dendriticum]
MGRLRRISPTVITGHQKVEFPGMFIEGFRDGHVGFNIPGLLQDSLKPTDSMEVKINLFTPRQHNESMDPSESTSPNWLRTTAGLEDDRVELPTVHSNNRFGLNWTAHRLTSNYHQGLSRLTEGSFDTMQFAEPNQDDAFPTSSHSSGRFGIIPRNPVPTSQICEMENHFSSALRFGEDSTASGLNSHLGPPVFQHSGLEDSVFSHYPSAPSRSAVTRFW